MLRIVAASFFLFVLLTSGVGAAESGANLCFTTPYYVCYDQIEWEIGSFWAHNPPSVANCAKYHYHFGGVIGDIWGMCNEYGMPDPDSPTASRPPDNGSNGANATNGANGNIDADDADPDYIFKLTSEWQPIPPGVTNLCPIVGLDPIINYEENTFLCATGF